MEIDEMRLKESFRQKLSELINQDNIYKTDKANVSFFLTKKFLISKLLTRQTSFIFLK